MKIGNYDIYALETERFALDGGAMFGTVPKTLWERTNPPDEKNRIDLSTRAMLIVGNGRNILVDTGIGQKWPEKLRAIYKVSESFLESNLARLGFRPEDITDVILTHLHFDHAGGAVKLVEGKPVLTFPNATFHLQEENYRWALTPNPRERASYLKENFMPIMDAGKFVFVNGETELFPGIFTLMSQAHTRGQQLIKVTDGENTLCYCADLIPTSSHIPVAWGMGYDLYPLELMEEKKRLLEQAVDENWTLFFEHDVYRQASRLIKGEKGIEKGDAVEMAH
ncbi:MAG: MBL fold metallo-hydrolase [Chlorobiales bacterium]|nr:MBL fold metallo-hydrolase [Chlorobiales bacterium]